MNHNVYWLSALGWALASTAISTAGPIVETQVFDNPALAAAAGWTGYRNSLDGNTFGFSATNFSGGLSPSGEAGGVIARTTSLAYYADLTLGGSPTFADRMQASGELCVTSVGAFNNAVRVGFFDANATTGPIAFAGFQVAEAQSPTGLLRVLASLHLSNGALIQSPDPIRIAIGSTYSWATHYDPLLLQLTVEVFDQNGVSLGTITTNSEGQIPLYPQNFNAFGLMTGGIGQAAPTNQATVYMDNLNYSFVSAPEPSSLLLLGIVGASAGSRVWFRRRPRCK